MGRLFTVVALLLLSVPALARGQAVQTAGEARAWGQGWPRWRGPQSSGIARDFRLPDGWTEEKSLAPSWTFALGTGWSSPVVDSKGRVFVTDRNQAIERLLALDGTTGKLLWQQSNPVDFDPHPVGRRHGNGPKSTPLVENGRVFSLGIAGWLEAVAADSGRPLWHINLPETFGAHEPLSGGRTQVVAEDHVLVPIGKEEGAPVPLFGYTGSPVADGRLLFVPVGGARGGTIMAFDVASGKEVWRALEENVSYSSPIVASLAGSTQLIVMTGPRVVGLDPATGRLLWSHPFQVQYDESIGTPVVAGDRVVFAGEGHPLTALDIERHGAGFEAHLAWENDDLSSYLSSMLAHDGTIYGMNDAGELVAVDAVTGKTLWTGSGEGYYCTPVLAGDRLLCLSDRGLLKIVAADRRAYHLLGECRLATRATWTSPAVAGSWMYVRTQDELRAFDLSR